MDLEVLLSQSFVSIFLGTPSLLLMFGIMYSIGFIRKQKTDKRVA
jgi:ABC-type amino acid transport system permease subunit